MQPLPVSTHENCSMNANTLNPNTLTHLFRLTIGLSLGLVSQPVAAGSPAPSPMPTAVNIEYSLTSPELQPFSIPLGEASDYLPATASPKATHIRLRLAERRVYVYSEAEVLASYPVAVGTASTPTPTGEFKVFQMVVNPVWQSPWSGEVFAPGPHSALGLRWIGFAHQHNGIIGFHGTPTVQSIGAAASNGCVRLRNADVLALYEYVAIGMPVIVEP